MDIATALATIKAAGDMGRGLLSVKQISDSAENRLQLHDVLNALDTARQALWDAREIAQSKDEEIKRLRSALAEKAEVAHYLNAYYRKDEQGQPDGHPYCMNCWEKNHELAHLTLAGRGQDECTCPRCKTKYARSTTYFLEHGKPIAR
jgi:hypothetical protein